MILTVIIITFTTVILIIIDKFLESNILKSLCYVVCSLFIVIIFTINSRILKEGKNILLCKKENKRNDLLEENEDEEEDDNEGIEFGNAKSDYLA